MEKANHMRIELRKYGEGDFPLLEQLLGDPVMMEHLGGPETYEQLAKRHKRYLQSQGCYVIIYGLEQKGVGWVGYWESNWKEEKVWETGWNVLPDYQRKGIATRGVKLVLEELKKEQKYQYVHAYPSGENEVSNALCKKTGFTLLEELELEYPKGHMMRCNDWRKDLKEKE